MQTPTPSTFSEPSALSGRPSQFASPQPNTQPSRVAAMVCEEQVETATTHSAWRASTRLGFS